ncbi:Zinc metalloproteinase nas-38 (Nematode astacin 38) [Durusdinium trenchii]|uniref:Metalloendopeptidase n=1 Tax=Durusdinium trenchii TaxID=1381693 RepID=A0ABP0LAQ1_9DINO
MPRNPNRRVKDNSVSCRIEATKLVGPDIYKSLRSNRDVQEEDLLYVTSIVRGEEILPPSPPEGYGNPPTKLEQEIPFSFASGLPNETKEVFQEAAELVARSTCIRFLETDGAAKLRILAGHSCGASRVGWSTGVDLQLGWCSSSYHLGAVLHELGHVLGLINEEERPDRSSFVLTDVPLQLETMAGPYDLGSVMQGQERVTTLPLVGSASSLAASGTRRTGVNDPLIGQRSGLSARDILKLRELYGCGPLPSSEIQEICLQLLTSCPANGLEGLSPEERWMSEHCSAICQGLEHQFLSFRFDFITPGFDLQKLEHRTKLGQGFAAGIEQALAANTTVEVLPTGATAQVTCGCYGAFGGTCRSCPSLKALLRRSSMETLQGWLQQVGFSQLRVTTFSVEDQDAVTWMMEDGGFQIGVCFVGTICAAFAVMQAAWYCWWTRKLTVPLDGELTE